MNDCKRVSRIDKCESALAIYAVLIACLMAPCLSAVAEDPVADPVGAGRESLSGPTAFPWYDPDTDSLRRIDVGMNQDDDAANRASKWESSPRSTNRSTGNFANNLSFGWLGTLFKTLAILLGVILVAALIALLIWAFLKGESSHAASVGEPDEEEEPEAEAERIERLPFQVERPQSDLLGEARRNYEAGNYAEAVIYFFSYQLVQLDKHHWIHLAKGKTNRQYLREIRQQTGLRDMLAGTMVAFEDVFFGHHPLSRERFERVWSRLDEFQNHVQQTSA